jgi:hypothetical protein
MGVGLRIFIVNDDNAVKRLALTRYERLMQRDPHISLPQYAGKRVRYAEVAVEFENRKPVEILRMEYFIMHFDSKGRIDGTVQDDIMNLGVNWKLRPRWIPKPP